MRWSKRFLDLLVRLGVLRFDQALNLVTRHLDRSASIEVGGTSVPLSTIASPDYGVTYWNGHIKLDWWPGGPKCFSISVNDSLPDESQVALLERLRVEAPLTRSEIEEAIFKYYQECIAPAGPTDWEGKPLRVVETTKALRRTIRGPQLIIDEPLDEEPLEWSLHFGADWDGEHGARLVFQNEKCIYVGN